MRHSNQVGSSLIARSNEAKALGIAMGAPLFKIRKLVDEHGVIVRSSNYALYGDISERVMSVLGSQAPAHEIYSIDECFLDLDRMAVADLTDWCRDLRRRTHKWTGIPVSIGVGPTKTLAKVANRLAKKSATYIETDAMKAAIKDLHFQQASVQMAIAQLEQLKARSPWATPWPWITIMALALIIAQALR